jgi:glycosyltransferase involved in cell wall biosynthesis
MRIILDLQGAQCGSSLRGAGRYYSLALAQAIARAGAQHEVWLALNGRMPESIEPLLAAFANLIPQERICLFELPGPVAERDFANSWRKQTAELLREKFFADLHPDIVHVSTLFEGFANEAVASVGRLDPTVPTAVTLFDSVAMLRSQNSFTDPMKKRFYLSRMQSLKRARLLLATSESARQQAIETLQISPERVRTIGIGLSLSFQENEVSCDARAVLGARYGLRCPFVLYMGGDEEAGKSLEQLITAFALLPHNLRAAHRLALVCKLPEDARRRLAAVAQQHGLVGDEVVYPGDVPDEDCHLLYSACSLFVFHSLGEQLGLPLLEAMALGTPVIGSSCAGIPEIINRRDALFDPDRPRDIADRMAQVLSNSELRESLKGWGRERAKAFTWEACADNVLCAFEALHVERKEAHPSTPRSNPQRRPLLAFVAPLPPERTGIAGYSAKLLPNLARHYEIVCIVDQPEVTDAWITAAFAIRDIRSFEANARCFDRIVYQFGNSSLHEHMFPLLARHPGIIVLHDFYLSHLLNCMEASGAAPGCFTKALYDSHGFFALDKDRRDGREASPPDQPPRGSHDIVIARCNL